MSASRRAALAAAGVAMLSLALCGVVAGITLGLGQLQQSRPTQAVATAASPPGPQAATQGGQQMRPPHPTRPRGPEETGAAWDTLEIVRQLELPMRDQVDLAARFHGVQARPRQVNRLRPLQVGDADTFWLHDILSEQYFQVEARVALVTDNVYWWVQDDVEVSPEGLRAAARQFEDDILPTNRRLFGSEWSPGVDLDPRLHVLHHQPIRGVGGYFSSADEFVRDVDPHSNQREMFYINASTHPPGSTGYLAVLAHEYQHMIHWHLDSDEPVWLNEGLSELATALNGLPHGGADEAFAQAPDTQLNDWSEDPTANSPHYGAAYLFCAYLLERYGESVLAELVARPENGIRGLEAVLANVDPNESFDGLFQDWVVANLLDEPGIGPGDGLGYRELDMPQVAILPGPEPLVLKEDTVGQYATDYVQLTPGADEVVFEGSPEVQLIDAHPPSGEKLWWSGRGDSGDSTLTREFDLSAAQSARLEYRIWYDLEENWDYAYIAASTDGGLTWQTLQTDRTTTHNPNGNNLGSGYTGRSQGWVTESVDLGTYSGARVRLRFEVVTDDAVNQPGLALDDIRLEAVGYRHDAEMDDGGWQANGFVRVAPKLPQLWSLQLIKLGPQPDVRRLQVSRDGSARFSLSDTPPDEPLLLAISATTPVTTERAVYRLGLSGE
jgi:hypothetical protein